VAGRIDELKTLVKNLVKVTEKNNDMIEELIRNSERQARQELYEVVNSLKSIAFSMQVIKDAHYVKGAHSVNRNVENDVAALKEIQGYQREGGLDNAYSDKETWQPNRNWLVGEDNYSLDGSGIGTQIFSNKIRDPG
jgi:hypothetical protein